MKEQKIRLPNLRRSRRSKKLSQPVLAKKAGVTTYQVCVAEADRLVLPSIAQKLAAALGIQPESLRK